MIRVDLGALIQPGIGGREAMTQSDLLTISFLALLFLAAICLAGQHNMESESRDARIDNIEAQVRMKSGPPTVYGKYVTVYAGGIEVDVK